MQVKVQSKVVCGILLFIYLGFYVGFNTVQVISQRVVLYGQRKPVHTVGQVSVL